MKYAKSRYVIEGDLPPYPKKYTIYAQQASKGNDVDVQCFLHEWISTNDVIDQCSPLHKPLVPLLFEWILLLPPTPAGTETAESRWPNIPKDEEDDIIGCETAATAADAMELPPPGWCLGTNTKTRVLIRLTKGYQSATTKRG